MSDRGKLAERVELDAPAHAAALLECGERSTMCNVCGAPAAPLRDGGCTNGRCARCHVGGYCTDGGSTYPGHYLTRPKSAK